MFVRAISDMKRSSLLCSRLLARTWHIRSAAGYSVKIGFKEGKSGDLIVVDAPTTAGKTVLDIALDHNIDIEGACGGEMACSTCHVIVPKEYFDKIPKKTEEEEDMLDLAFGLTDTSRLCCQIKVSDVLDGAVFTIPEETNNMLK